MAGFGATTPAHPPPSATFDRETSTKRSLPNGPCNFRDPAAGLCGCDQFWDKCSVELHEASREHRPGSERSTWCVCGHHACFHLREPRVPQPPQPSEAGAFNQAQAQCNDGGQLQTETHCDAHTGVRSIEGVFSPPESSQTLNNARLKASHPSLSWHLLQQTASQANGSGPHEDNRDNASQPSTSGLPRVPSVCFLSHDRPPAADHEARSGANEARQSVGLGLSMLNLQSVGSPTNRPQSATSTVPDDINIEQRLLEQFNERAASSTTAVPTPGGPSASMIEAATLHPDHLSPDNRNLHLDIGGDTIPNTYNIEEFLQSATEAATPNLVGTPNFTAADQAVHETKKLVDTLFRLTHAEQCNGLPGQSNNATSAPPPQLLMSNSPAAHQEQLQKTVRDASPQAVQKLISYLTPLHNLLNTLPNVAHALREINSRLDMLENNSSFNYVHPDDLQQHLESYESRLIELEHRLDDQDRVQQQIDADQNSSSFSQNRVATITESFTSNHSVQSLNSSALILSAVDRKDIDTELGSIKDRLDVLEATAMPSSINPWEVEVVLLPWGRELRGIWFSADEPMHDLSKATTQDSEEWTQAQNSKLAQSMRSARSRSRTPQPLQRDTDSSPQRNAMVSLFSESESGWSSEAISDWASGSTDAWLSPKACGSNNLVYKRLQSRGFVRNVTLKSTSSRDIQAALSSTFRDLLEHLQYTEHDDDPTIRVYPGLRASFIPLRKAMKESKLRFLTPSEMSSSALWSAQFLASGVLMRVSGGKKRLYVTQRESYLQHGDQMGSSWTWQEIRQLPRFQPGQDFQMEGNDAGCQPTVPEADAKEACWQYIDALDAPPLSVNSSFSSHQSMQIAMRPADRQWRRSITPSSILKNKQAQPISPLSENRPLQFRNRTASSSVVEQAMPGSSKRRYDASPVKHSSVPHSHSRTPSASITRLKRRRVTGSSSPREGAVPIVMEAPVTLWTNTPRRSREPPSPHLSSQPGLPRSNSDATSRPSQRSLGLTSKSAPFAYATPHSGPFLTGTVFGGFRNEGDTEPDNNDYQDDDGEQSWHGVTTGTEGSGDEGTDVEAGAEEPTSFSGDDSGFGTDEDDGESEDDALDRFGAQRDDEFDDAELHLDEDDDESERILDEFLGVLRD